MWRFGAGRTKSHYFTPRRRDCRIRVFTLSVASRVVRAYPTRLAFFVYRCLSLCFSQWGALNTTEAPRSFEIDGKALKFGSAHPMGQRQTSDKPVLTTATRAGLTARLLPFDWRRAPRTYVAFRGIPAHRVYGEFRDIPHDKFCILARRRNCRSRVALNLNKLKTEHKSAEPLDCGGLAPLFFSFLQTKSGAKRYRG
jgi:hypothetical protein